MLVKTKKKDKCKGEMTKKRGPRQMGKKCVEHNYNVSSEGEKLTPKIEHMKYIHL